MVSLYLFALLFFGLFSLIPIIIICKPQYQKEMFFASQMKMKGWGMIECLFLVENKIIF